MAQNNQITLIGNLGSAPETYKGKNDKPFMRLSLCTTDSYKDEKSGEWIDTQPLWHTVFIYSPQVQSHAAYGNKGNRFEVQGKISYINKETVVEGKSHKYREAVIIAQKITPAPLTKKSA